MYVYDILLQADDKEDNMLHDEYEQILTNMSEAYVLINISCSRFKSDYSFITKKINPFFEKLTGLEKENVVGCNLSHVLGLDSKSLNAGQFESYTKSKIVEIELYSSFANMLLSFKFFPTSLAHIGCIISKAVAKEDYYPVLSQHSLDCHSLNILNHEIRTPLNGLMGMLQLLNETNLNDEQRNILNLGNSSAHRLLEFVNLLSDVDATTHDVDSYSFELNNNLHPNKLLRKSDKFISETVNTQPQFN